MPIELDDDTATVVGTVAIEDVETLVNWLREGLAKPGERRRVDLRSAMHLHTGAVRALLAFRTQVTGPPADLFLARHVMPLLESQDASTPDRSESP